MYPSMALLKLLLGSPTLLLTSKASDSTFFMKHFLFPQLVKTSLPSNSCYCFNCSALLRVWRNLFQGYIHEATWKDLLFVRHCNGYWGSRNDLTASLFYIKKALFWSIPLWWVLSLQLLLNLRQRDYKLNVSLNRRMTTRPNESKRHKMRRWIQCCSGGLPYMWGSALCAPAPHLFIKCSTVQFYSLFLGWKVFKLIHHSFSQCLSSFPGTGSNPYI